jgi:3',5'-cyclic AMP phosphodiesterase CpdA
VLSGPVLASLDRPRTDRSVRVAVVADPHVAEGRGTWKMAHRSKTLFARAVTAANAADAAVLAGDLTGDGRRDSFAAVDEVLADLAVPWVAVPGNHDVPKRFDSHDGLPVSGFQRRYTESPFARAVGPVTLVGLNTASMPDERLRATWGGRVGERDRAWLAETLADAETPVVICHHNVATLPENPGGKWLNFPLRDADAVREVLTDHGVGLVVSGHHHVPAVADHGGTTEILAPATCSYPQAMLSLEFGPEGTVVRYVPLAAPAELREARHHAVTGKPLGVGIVEMAERRLGSLPLLDR